MKKCFSQSVLHKLLSLFLISFVLDQGAIVAQYPNNWYMIDRSEKETSSSTDESSGTPSNGSGRESRTIYINTPQHVANTLAAQEQAKLEKEEQEKQRIEEEKKKKEQEEKEQRKAIKIEEKKKRHEEKQQRRLEKEKRRVEKQKAKEEVERKAQEERERIAAEEAERERIKKAKEKLQNDEALNRKDDEEFNGGEQRKKLIDDLLESLRAEGKGQEIAELESFLQNPQECSLSEWANCYFGKDVVKQLDYHSRDFIDYKITNLINDTSKTCYALEWSPLGCRYISHQLQDTLVSGKNSITKQIDLLSSENNIQSAYDLSVFGNTLNKVGEHFYDMVTNIKDGFKEKGKERFWETKETIERTYNNITQMINDPIGVLESMSDIVTPIIDAQLFNEIAKECPDFAARAYARQHNFSNAVQQTKEQLLEKATTLASSGMEVLAMAVKYGSVFARTQEEELWGVQEVPKELIQDHNDRFRELVEMVHQSFDSISSKNVGEMAADALIETIKSTLCNKVLSVAGEVAFANNSAQTMLKNISEVASAENNTHTLKKSVEKVAKQAYTKKTGLSRKGLKYAHNIKGDKEKQALKKILKDKKALEQCGGADKVARSLRDAERELKQKKGYDKHIQDFKNASTENIKGKMYETEKALELQRQGRVVEGIGLKTTDFPNGKEIADLVGKNCEFDVTVSDALIECKHYSTFSSVDKVQKQIGKAQKTANLLNRKYEFHAKGSKIPAELKQWLNKRGIPYQED